MNSINGSRKTSLKPQGYEKHPEEFEKPTRNRLIDQSLQNEFKTKQPNLNFVCKFSVKNAEL